MDSSKSLARISTAVAPLAGYEPLPPRLPSSVSEPPRAPGFLDFWRVIQTRKWSILVFCASFFALIAYATLKMVPIYEATTTLAIYREGPDILGFHDDSAAAEEDYTVNLDTESEIISSDSLALQVAGELGLDQNPAFTKNLFGGKGKARPSAAPDNRLQASILRQFRQSLSVKKIPHTRLIEIQYFSSDPQLAARVVNVLSSDYINQNFAAKFNSAMSRSDWLTRELSNLQATVRASQEKLVRFQRENKIPITETQQSITNARLMKLDYDATAAQVEVLRKQADYKSALQGDPVLISRLDSLGRMTALRRRESELAGQRASLAVDFGPSYPRVAEVASQLQQVREEIALERKLLIGRFRHEYAAAKERASMLHGALERQKQESSELNERSIQYAQLKRETDSSRKIFDALLDRLKEAGISAGLRANNIRIVESARVPVRPARPDVPLNLLLGFATGLAGAIALAFLFENMDSTLRSMEQVEAVTSLPVLAVIPFSAELISKPPAAGSRPNGRKHRLAGPSDGSLQPFLQRPGQHAELALVARPRSELSESYRALRTSILLSTPGSPPQVIMVTSSLTQEGKTTTSVNTAILLAQQGGRVLLVDADLRRPSVHQLFDISSRRGLSTFLAGEDADPETIAVASVPGLFVVPAGPAPPHPAELLASSVMREQLMRWRVEYDHIVIDTPPVLSVTDAVVLSVEADAVVLVIRASSTTREALRRSRDLLLQVNSRLMGVIVNAVDSSSPDSYSYYYGAKNGGGYYEEAAQTV